MNFKKQKEEFDIEVSKSDGFKIMEKVTSIVNEIGNSFLEMNGGELAEAQSKLAGYKFYLADYIGEINREYESIKLELKHTRSSEWDRITEEIKAKEGKVKNKEQIENVLVGMTIESQNRQMLFETLYYKYKLKISSIDSILTAVTQRIAELKRQIEQQ